LAHPFLFFFFFACAPLFWLGLPTQTLTEALSTPIRLGVGDTGELSVLFVRFQSEKEWTQAVEQNHLFILV